MKSINVITLPIVIGLLFSFWSCSQKKQNDLSVTWKIDNLERIGGHPVKVSGEPKVIETDNGRAVYFDGVDDGLLVQGNPLDEATAFTVEVVFRPDPSYPDNAEQRFIHIQNPDNNDRRIMIETRLTPDNKWFLDTFIRSESSTRPLLAKDFQHTIGEWHHAAVVYKDGVMRHYVDGVEEMSGEVIFRPIDGAYVSLGVRMNQVFWFKGAIRTLRVSNRVLQPKEFFNPDN